MKRLLSVILCVVCALLAGGCGGSETKTPPEGGGEGGVDVDLTAMSKTVAYAVINEIMANPGDYIGKTVKINGPYANEYYDKTDLYYHYVVIEGDGACCIQWLEFIRNGDHAFPEDYPPQQEKIQVTGVFGSYDELGVTYYYLAADDMTVLA
ncbi:MAG: hypothetical protein LBI36_06685 [Oscillospiraceae bacterium]|jgi:hypothetical protein|nr:hypothetical protein [Oscillospiraceae bacterium]